jgi:hypothetical protein
VEYDGFKEGVLKEAKAEGYRAFFEEGGQPKPWYEESGNFQGLLDQAENQSKAAGSLRLEWHVAEREMVEILRKHFAQEKIKNIQIIFTPPGR